MCCKKQGLNGFSSITLCVDVLLLVIIDELVTLVELSTEVVSFRMMQTWLVFKSLFNDLFKSGFSVSFGRFVRFIKISNALFFCII